jgi:hypothetical protein
METQNNLMPDTYPPRDTAMETALSALKEIARHEKECSRRWGDAHRELKIIRERLRAHSMRWERLAWMVIGTMTAGVVAVIVQASLK